MSRWIAVALLVGMGFLVGRVSATGDEKPPEAAEKTVRVDRFVHRHLDFDRYCPAGLWSVKLHFPDPGVTATLIVQETSGKPSAEGLGAGFQAPFWTAMKGHGISLKQSETRLRVSRKLAEEIRGLAHLARKLRTERGRLAKAVLDAGLLEGAVAQGKKGLQLPAVK